DLQILVAEQQRVVDVQEHVVGGRLLVPLRVEGGRVDALGDDDLPLGRGGGEGGQEQQRGEYERDTARGHHRRPPSRGPPYHRGAPRLRRGAASVGGFGGPFRGPPSGGIRGEPHRLRARLVVGDHVDDGGLARRERPLERGPDVVRLLDELAVRAQVHGHAVVAGVA